MLTVNRLVFNPFEENTYIIAEKNTGNAIVIDPGMFVAQECKQFDDYVAQNGFHLLQIVNTHLHLDHAFGINYVREKYGIRLAAHPDDANLGQALNEQGIRFGFGNRNEQPVDIDIPLSDGDTVLVGDTSLSVLHVPGHSQGGIALYCADEQFAVVGDSIFRHSIGRTDFIGGDQRQLIESLHTQLLSLPKETVLLPGHGPHTTVGEELQSNPYI